MTEPIIKTGSDVCLYTPVSPSVAEMEGIYATGGILFLGCTFGGVIYLVFTRSPSGVTVGDSDICCCVSCLSSAIIPPCLLILFHFVHRFTKMFIWYSDRTESIFKCLYLFHIIIDFSAKHYFVFSFANSIIERSCLMTCFDFNERTPAAVGTSGA